VLALYEETIDQLIVMQTEAAIDFDERWCWDTPRYDRQLMLVRESGYFIRSFWQEMLGRPIPDGLEDEFLGIADQAAEAPAGFFLHRDFQSRNLMVKDGQIRIIDFQGGRRGPLAYDLASLLIDPYAALPRALQDQLLHRYLERLGRRMPDIDSRAFLRHYSLLALQRNLQIIGAFAFLSRVRGKVFFADYIRPAVVMLHTRLQEPIFQRQSVLRHMAASALEALDRRIQAGDEPA
jgi:aminoglycoside/choline kinase family phosphotransferase